jgi:hypothetical protein
VYNKIIKIVKKKINNKKLIKIFIFHNLLGELMGEIVIRLFEGLRDVLINNMNIHPNEFDKLLESFRNEMNIYKTYATHNRVFAMKVCDE